MLSLKTLCVRGLVAVNIVDKMNYALFLILFNDFFLEIISHRLCANVTSLNVRLIFFFSFRFNVTCTCELRVEK